MHQLRQLTQRTFVVLVALAFVLLTAHQAASQEAASQAQPQPAPAALQSQSQTQATAMGELVEVDAKASTFSVKTAAAEMKFRYDDQTKVSGGQKSVAGLATMTGSQVTVQYRKDGANNIATSIEVRPAATRPGAADRTPNPNPTPNPTDRNKP